LASKQDVEREQCATYCKTSLDEAAAASEATTGDNPHHPNHHPLKKNFFPQQPISRARRNEKAKVPVVMYNWHSDDPQDMDTQTGRCHCISVLHSVKLSFGSFSGFQLS
jgi:hypothetical protein